MYVLRVHVSSCVTMPVDMCAGDVFNRAYYVYE